MRLSASRLSIPARSLSSSTLKTCSMLAVDFFLPQEGFGGMCHSERTCGLKLSFLSENLSPGPSGQSLCVRRGVQTEVRLVMLKGVHLTRLL